MGFPGGSDGKESTGSAGDLGWEDALEEGTATRSSILAWRIPWAEEPGGLLFMWSPRVGHDWVTFTHTHTHTHTYAHTHRVCCTSLSLPEAGMV